MIWWIIAADVWPEAVKTDSPFAPLKIMEGLGAQMQYFQKTQPVLYFYSVAVFIGLTTSWSPDLQIHSYHGPGFCSDLHDRPNKLQVFFDGGPRSFDQWLIV